MRRAMLLSVLAGCAILTWAATTLDALLTLSVVSLVAAGLVIREVRGPIDFDADVRVATVGFASLLCGTGLLLALTGTTDLAGIESTLAANYQPDRSDLLTGRGFDLGSGRTGLCARWSCLSHRSVPVSVLADAIVH